MQWRAFGLSDVADRNGGEEVRLAFDRGGGLARLEIGGGRGAAEVVGKRHQGAAMHDSEPVVEIIAGDELSGDPFGRDMRYLEAEKFGKWWLPAGRVVHSNPQPKQKQ